jgi:DNA-binding NarL/FixJ family response regulator
VQKLILPHLAKLRNIKDESRDVMISLIEQDLKDLLAPHAARAPKALKGLSPAQMEIANLMRGGFSTKQIAAALNISARTVEVHRQAIRKKLELVGTKTPLDAYLHALE